MWKSKGFLLAAGGIVVFVSVAVAAVWPHASDPMKEFLTENHYREVAPPSDFYAPGTINTVEALSNGKIALHPTCEANLASLGITPSENPTINVKYNLAAGFDVSAHVKNLVSSSLAQNTNWSVHVSINNVSVLTLSDEALATVQKKVIQGGCEDVIVGNMKNGGTVCQTSDAIRADLVYKISFKDGVKVDEQSEVRKEVSEKLALKAVVQQGDEIRGNRLFFGVKLRPNGPHVERAWCPARNLSGLDKLYRALPLAADQNWPIRIGRACGGPGS